MDVQFHTNLDHKFNNWVFPKIPIEYAVHIKNGDMIELNRIH